MTDTITPNVPIAISASLKVDDVNVLARSTETVPDAADGMDQRISLLVIDFPTYAADIDVDDICRGIEMKIPNMLQKHGPRNHLTNIAYQILQQLELTR